MKLMTPSQARAARAMLNLDMKTVCRLAAVGKRTLTEFESGFRTISDTTKVKIKAFYISRGIEFVETADHSQVVSFKSFAAYDLENLDSIRDKDEYIDLFGAREIDDAFRSIEDTLDKLSRYLFFSRKLLNEIMAKENINQKQLALILECSPAFISSIIVGKKLIPASMVEKLHRFYRNSKIDMKIAITCERNLGASILAITKLITAAKNELNALSRGGI